MKKMKRPADLMNSAARITTAFQTTGGVTARTTAETTQTRRTAVSVFLPRFSVTLLLFRLRVLPGFRKWWIAHPSASANPLWWWLLLAFLHVKHHANFSAVVVVLVFFFFLKSVRHFFQPCRLFSVCISCYFCTLLLTPYTRSCLGLDWEFSLDDYGNKLP